MKVHVLLSAMLIAMVLVSGCTQYSTGPAPTNGQQGNGQKPTGDASTDGQQEDEAGSTGQLREFTVEGSEFSFSPASVTVTKGDRVKITFKNVGSVGHNFVIDELGISTRVIASGATDTVEFTASTTGTFSFYCSVGNHRAAGMEGQLNVG